MTELENFREITQNSNVALLKKVDEFRRKDHDELIKKLEVMHAESKRSRNNYSIFFVVLFVLSFFNAYMLVKNEKLTKDTHTRLLQFYLDWTEELKQKYQDINTMYKRNK